MSAAPQGQPAPPLRAKRGRLYVLAVTVMLVGFAALSYQLIGPFGSDGDGGPLRRVIFPVKRRPPSAPLGVEYHYDKNAVVDSRVVGTQIVGLTGSGNLVVVDGESFALRKERVLNRRGTCLGPVDGERVVVGIANGCIVRVALPDLFIEKVGEIPGVPRWIGKRADGTLVVAYQRDNNASGALLVTVLGSDRADDVGMPSSLYLDSKDRLWIAAGAKVLQRDLATGAGTAFDWKGGWQGVRGFVELADGQVWTFGGVRRGADMASFVARLLPGAKPAMLYQKSGNQSQPPAPTAPITQVLDDPEGGRILVVSHGGVSVGDPGLRDWQSLDTMGSAYRDDDALLSLGSAHRIGRGVVLSLARGGFMELTSEYARRHVLEGQIDVNRPTEIVRLEKGMAIFGEGRSSFYVDHAWRSLPDPVVPPAELMGPPRQGESTRIWTAMLTIPLDSQRSFVIAKAGAPRLYRGHIHGLRDTFLTARWDGSALSVLGREDLPIEPADTFKTPDDRLWNVDDQGLWSFSSGRWHMVMRAPTQASKDGGHGVASAVVSGRAVFRSGIGEPLHFAASAKPPYYGLPVAASSWALVRLDKNEEGGVPLIDEVPVTFDGQRVLIHDLTAWQNKHDELLLATDHGPCVFSTKWGTCTALQVSGLDEEVTVLARDGANRLWLGGKGLWVLADPKYVVPVHTAIPMLADTRVVGMAAAGDGRMVVGLEDRGIIFVTLPEGWLSRAPELPTMPVPWERPRPHESCFRDPSVVLRECPDKGASLSDASRSALVEELRKSALSISPYSRVTTEAVYEGRPDIAVRGDEPDQLLEKALSAIDKLGSKGRFEVWKRKAGRGSESTRVRLCPGS